jgi:hypothetical protein
VLYFVKTIIAALIIMAVTEVSKVNLTLGALIKSLPLISLVSMIWLYVETKNSKQVANLSTSTFWLVIPTLPFFLVFPFFIRMGLSFFVALSAGIVVMVLSYVGATVVYRWLGIGF